MINTASTIDFFNAIDVLWSKQDPMDAFLGLYDNGSDSEDDWIGDLKGLDLTDIKNLPPEPQSGNIEYKLKLVNPTEHRIQHLVTQVA